jgi:hypothetical protein
VRAAASLHPFLEPYVRYWVTIPSAADWEMALDGTASSRYHGVTFDFREPELVRRVALAHASGLGVWIDNVPGPRHGEVVLAGLRQLVDGFSTDYRIDQARSIVSAKDVQAGFDATPLVSPEEPLLVYYLQPDGTIASWQRVLAVPTGEELGTPELAWWSDNGPFSGGALDFAPGDRTMRLTDPPVGALEGVLVSVSATLGDAMAIAPGEFANILSSATSMAAGEHQGGVALRVARAAQGGALALQFAVHAGDRYWVHEYPFAGGSTGACPSPNGTFTEPLEEGRAYWLLGVYDGDGPVQLFIDGKCAGAAAPEANGPVTASLFAPLVGAQPETALPGGSGFFRGVVQSAQLLSWPSHDADGTN